MIFCWEMLGNMISQYFLNLSRNKRLHNVRIVIANYIAGNLVYNSDINIPAEEWCEKNKILFDISLRLYLKIKVNEPDLFRKLCKYWEENR